MPTTTALTLSSAVRSDSQPVTLTATVAGPPGAQAAPGGTIAFIDLGTPGYSVWMPNLDRTVFTFVDPVTHDERAAALLGTAALDAGGTASLLVPSVTDTVHDFRAVYLGADRVLHPRATDSNVLISADFGFGVDQAIDGPAAAESHRLVDLPVYYQPQATVGTAMVFPDGHPFAIHGGVVTFLDALPGGVTPTPFGSWVSEDDLRDSTADDVTFYFAATATPLQVYATSTSTVMFYDHFAYRVVPTLTAADGSTPADRDPEYQTSVSDAATLVPQATRVHFERFGQTTFTNPPNFVLSLDDSAGKTFSRANQKMTLTVRGTTQTAYASANVVVSTPSSTGGTTGNGSLTIGSGGGTIFPPHVFRAPGPFPTGTFTIYDNGQAVATVPLDADGNARWAPDPGALALGDHTITASYSGDASYLPATGDAASFTITHTPTSVSLIDAPTVVYSGKLFGLVARVMTAVADTVVPGGNVTFTVDGQPLVTRPLSSDRNAVGERVALTLAVGTHTISVSYPGDADCLPAERSYTLEVVDPPVVTQPVVPPEEVVVVGRDPLPAFELPHVDDYSLTGVSVLTPSIPVGGRVELSAWTQYAGGPFPGTIQVAFYLSADAISGNGDDVLLGTANKSLLSLPVATAPDLSADLPATLPAGTYHVYAVIDPGNHTAETDETNNVLFSNDTIEVYRPLVTGTVAVRPGKLKPGNKTTFKLSLSNQAGTRVKYKYNVRYYFSENQTLDVDDVQLSEQTLAVTLAAGQTRTFPVDYKVPAQLPVGTGYVIAVAEPAANPTLATRVQAVTPGALKVRGPRLTAAIHAAAAGAQANTAVLTVRVRNDGAKAFSGRVTIRVILEGAFVPDRVLTTVTRRLSVRSHQFADVTFQVLASPTSSLRVIVY